MSLKRSLCTLPTLHFEPSTTSLYCPDGTSLNTHRFGKHLLLEFWWKRLLKNVVLVLVCVCVCGWVSVFVWSAPPGQGEWHCICTTGLSSRNVIMSRLGSRWWGRWSLTISSLNGSQGAHSRKGLVYTTLLLSAAVKLEEKEWQVGKCK